VAGTKILQLCLRPEYPQAEGRSGVLEAAQTRNGIRCSVDEEGSVVSIHEVAEVFTANVDPRFVFHVPQDPIDSDTEEGWTPAGARTQPCLYA